MIRYEILLLAVPEITSQESKDLETSTEKIVQSHKASVISFERWGKYKLAFPIKRHDYGVYFLLRFETTTENAFALLDELQTFFTVKLNDVVMRRVVRRLQAGAPLSYHRPESLEEMPTRDVETFLKESKMTGLLSPRGGHDGAHRRGTGREVRQEGPLQKIATTEEDIVIEHDEA